MAGRSEYEDACQFGRIRTDTRSTGTETISEKSGISERYYGLYRIDAHLADDITIERLSEIFAISTSHMRKIYKDETGMTIKDRVSERRLAAAKKLLGDPRLKIQEIADQVGYLTVQSLPRHLKWKRAKRLASTAQSSYGPMPRS